MNCKFNKNSIKVLYKDGFSILRELRREKIETPVIMLTAKSEIYDKLNGLENGANVLLLLRTLKMSVIMWI